MTSTRVELWITDMRGREHPVRAVMSGPGWVVEAAVDDRPFSKYCDNWQSVERTMYWLRRRAGDPPRPRRAWSGVAAAMVVMCFFSAGIALGQAPRDQTPAVRAFIDATRDYAVLHRQLEGRLPRLEPTSSPEDIYRAVQAMAAAVRAARPAAAPGDFFTEALAIELRARIAEALAAKGLTPLDVRATEAVEAMTEAMPPLQVNGRFPWLHATSMFPCIINALPPLPPELQYRIVGYTLVLVDLHADLIVDLLPYALADTER